MRHALLAFSLVCAVVLPAQDTAKITVDRLWGSGEFSPERFGPARWLDDGSGYTTVERSAAGQDIVRYDPATGARSVLVSAAQLTPATSRRALGVADYSWSPDGTKLIVFTNTRRVWRDNTRGDYWVLDLGNDRLHKLGGTFEPTWLMFAKFSPQSDRVAYVYKNDVYVENLTTGKITRLTDDGSATIINGTFDWVYEEELHVQDGFRWSPDGTKVAYWQLDAEGVGEFYMIDNLSDVYAKIVPVQYPKAGTANSSARVGVVDANGGRTKWMEIPGDPRNNYIARMEWAANSDELVVQHLNRLQNRNHVRLCNTKTGQCRVVFAEQESAWLDAVDDFLWLDDGARFTWVSERDGWRRVYLVDRTSGNATPVTKGDWEVLEIAHIDVAGGHVYVIASPDDPTRRALYRVPLEGGDAERLTPEDARGVHAYQISKDAKWAIHTASSFGRAPVVDLVSLPDHRVVRTLVDNARLQATVDALDQGAQDFFRVETSDGVTLDGWLIKPPDFDPTKKWPVVFHVYGEPWSQTVVDRWGGTNYIWHLMLAQRGYVVASFDNRGTPAPRGRDWRKCVYGAIGVLASRDQAAGLRAMAERWDWVDTDRIGIWGWSGGGSMTLNMLFRHPERYHVGVSVAPVPDQRLYDTIYQERYMGLPEANAKGYREGSPITYAHQLEGDLLLIHGTADDNVHYQGAERLVDALIEHDKQFAFMAYPGRSHGIHERPNTRRHLYKLMTRYLLDKLPPGAR